MNKYIIEMIKLAKNAYDNDDVPVGAIVVKNGKIIGRGFNKKNKSKIVTDHAEIIAIKEASKKIHDWRLDECELYVTLEPCKMCCEVIKQSRIKKVYYLLNSNFYNESQREIKYEVIDSEKKQEYCQLLSCFFSGKR